MSILKEVNVEIFVIVIVLICALAFLFLAFKEKKLKNTLDTKLNERDKLFLEIDKLGISEEPPKELVNKVDEIAKTFFEKELKIPRSTDYSELTTIFKDKNRPHLVQFADTMTKLLYAGEEPTKRTVLDLVFDLENAVGKEREQKRIDMLKAKNLIPESQEVKKQS